jgi:hypothetical protein
MEREAEKTLYWGKVATLKYQCQTEKPIIEIDLHHLSVDQREYTDEGTAEAGESEGGSEGVGTKREQVEA